ncbi:MAG: nuclear transport factor 2 family protein [Flavobacteriales bacterium]|nr:nuclear transport factor 2 family protein [Flavobacteriales bacterium]MCC6936908.1 nuclear transport factor 2 family protein [Flavobacteriales bacterium]
MNAQANKGIAYLWIEDFNAHDLESLLDLYAEDAEHFSPKLQVRQPETKGLIKGKDALRAWWANAFERLPSLRYELKKLVADERTVFMEYIRHVDGEADLLVGEVLELRDGVIIASRVYHG